MSITTKKSFCHLCQAVCGVLIDVDDNKFTKVLSDKTDISSHGYICEKSQRLIEFQQCEERITTPLKRINDEFISIGWEQAVDEISNKLKSIEQKDKIFYMAPLSPQYNINTMYSFEMMKHLGVRFLTNVLSTEKAYSILVESEFHKNFTCRSDRKNTEVLFVIGQNPWITQNYPEARKILNDIKKDPNRYLIVADTVTTETAAMANHYIKVKPSTDAWFLSALIKVIIENNFIDEEFINTRTENFPKIKSHFLAINLDEYLKFCGVSYEQILEIAKIINSSNSLIIDKGNGVCHQLYPFAIEYLTTLLYLIVGSFQKPGCVVLADHYYFDKIIYYFDERATPITNQTQFFGIMPVNAVADNLKNFKCAIIDNNDPVGRMPNSNKIGEELSKLELVVVLDSFRSESTKFADYILPTPTFFERMECICPANPRKHIIQLSNPIVKNDNSKEINEIYETLLENLGLMPNLSEYKKVYAQNPNQFYTVLLEKYKNKQTDVYYILKKIKGAEYKYYQISFVWWEFFSKAVYRKDKSIDEAITIADQIVAEFVTNNVIEFDADIDDANDKINLTPSYFLSVLYLSNTRIQNKDFKFILQCGTRQKTSMNGVIQNKSENLLEINNDDAEELQINDGETILLQTPLINFKIKCKIVSNLQQGLLQLPNSKIINFFSNNMAVDHFNPNFKFVFVNLRKLDHGTS